MAFKLAFPKETTEKFNVNRETKIRHMRSIISNRKLMRELESFDDPTMMIVLGSITIKKGEHDIKTTVIGINSEREIIEIVTEGTVTKEYGWVTVPTDVYIGKNPEKMIDDLESELFGDIPDSTRYEIMDGDPAGEFGTIDDFLERSRWRVVNAEKVYKKNCDKFIYEVYFTDINGAYYRGTVVSDSFDYLHPSILTDIDPDLNLVSYNQVGIITALDPGLYRVMLSSSRHPAPGTASSYTEEELEEVNMKGRGKGDSTKHMTFKMIEHPELPRKEIKEDERSIRLTSRKSVKVKFK